MHINPFAVSAGSSPEKKDREKSKAKALGQKVRNAISANINLPRVKESSLLATAIDPTQMIIPSSGTKKGHPVAWRPPKIKRDLRSHLHLPIGLKRSDGYPWINALMQFFLFLPSCREILSYIPNSLQGIKEFADRYFCDSEQKKGLSGADGDFAGGCLLNKFPNLFKEKDRIVNLDEAVQLIWQSAGSFFFERPAWHLLWDVKKGAEAALFEAGASAFEWLVGLQQLYEREDQFPFYQGRSLERQYHLKETNAYMELDAFVEARTDEGQKTSYFAYLKVGGSWVQCADERIASIKNSRSLEMPLQRGILFHFRRVALR